MESLTSYQIREILLYVANKIIENREYLTEVDRVIGDGDHGIGMALGMKKVKDQLETLKNTDDVYRLFDETGKAMIMSMGGASGVIFSMLFMGGAKNKIPSSEISTREFAEMMQCSLEKIKNRGGASIGDKTMIDAFEPAVQAMQANVENGFEIMLISAEQAAHDGVESTKRYVAKFGRAKSLMERAVGHQDAGATSTYIIIRSMREKISEFAQKGCTG